MNSDWEKLSKVQQMDIEVLREVVCDYFTEATKSFYKAHPDLQLTWSFTIDALIRGQHDTLRDKKP